MLSSQTKETQTLPSIPSKAIIKQYFQSQIIFRISSVYDIYVEQESNVLRWTTYAKWDVAPITYKMQQNLFPASETHIHKGAQFIQITNSPCMQQLWALNYSRKGLQTWLQRTGNSISAKWDKSNKLTLISQYVSFSRFNINISIGFVKISVRICGQFWWCLWVQRKHLDISWKFEVIIRTKPKKKKK